MSKLSTYIGDKTHDIDDIDSSWAQGRSVFGGLTAAIVLSRIESNHDIRKYNLKKISVNFCSPTKSLTDYTIKTEILSSGKSVKQITGMILQAGKITTQVTAVYVLERNSTISIDSNCVPPTSQPESYQPIPFIENVTPNFIQHVDIRIDSGNLPFSGKKHRTLSGWMQWKQKALSDDEYYTNPLLIGLIDAWPPAVLPHLKVPAPASSITWDIDIIQPDALPRLTEFLYYDCTIEHAYGGYANTYAHIRNQNGDLIALSKQLVGVYDSK